jgi:tetratricopeptide (TPR) repeat protein
LANCSDIHYWLGCAYDSVAGQADARREARRHWKIAAGFRGDFQAMSLRQYSEMTYYSARSLERLERKEEAVELFQALLEYARQLAEAPAKVDYFATSLPTMLLFEDDLDKRQQQSARFLEAQALHGLGRESEALERLREMVCVDPNNPFAADFLREVQSPTPRLPEPTGP